MAQETLSPKLEEWGGGACYKGIQVCPELKQELLILQSMAAETVSGLG